MKFLGSKYVIWAAVIILFIALVFGAIALKKKNWRRKLADLAMDEHVVWNFGKTKETDPKMRENLTKYWNAANAPDYGYGAAWSAAFISWLFKSSGADDKFPYASSHSVYIRKAVENRKAGVKNNALIGYKPEEYSPRIGDLICFARQSGVTFDTTHAYDSHCGIVVDINKGEGKLTTIDGNVSDSASKSTYDINKSGKITTQKVFAVLKNAI